MRSWQPHTAHLQIRYCSDRFIVGRRHNLTKWQLSWMGTYTTRLMMKRRNPYRAQNIPIVRPAIQFQHIYQCHTPVTLLPSSFASLLLLLLCPCPLNTHSLVLRSTVIYCAAHEVSLAGHEANKYTYYVTIPQWLACCSVIRAIKLEFDIN